MIWRRISIRRATTTTKLPRFLSTQNGTRLVVRSFGEPTRVLQKETFEIPQNIAKNQVLVKVLGSSINPVDINYIQGAYALKPNLPATPGFEGTGEIIKVGTDVKSFGVGDKIIPRIGRCMMWTTHAVCGERDVIKIPTELPLVNMATLSVNPPTAYRLLKDYLDLAPGDSVVQNGANGAMGQCIIQVAKDLGVRTINVVRNRTEIQKLKDQLKELGADVVTTEEEIRTLDTNELFSKLKRPKLGLNCVGGTVATDTLRLLADDGTVVTYGGMSKQPLTLSTTQLMFRNITAKGFTLSRWQGQNVNTVQEKEMVDYLSNLSSKGKLRPPFHKTFPLREYERAVEEALRPFGNTKIVLTMEDS